MDTRRRFLVGSSASLGLAAVGGCSGKEPLDCAEGASASGQADTAACTETSEDILGPFFREDAPERADLNVTGDEGTPLSIQGRVLHGDCATGRAGALVEVWQADSSGAYDNETDDFAFRASVVADADGAYSFASVLPGRYLNGGTYRPRHIHVRVTHDGLELVTQLYFCGDPYLEDDPWASAAPDRQIELAGTEETEMSGVFDVVLA